MQRVIHKLPSVLIDQIAAGEVVERPASVVKELVENALDAGATHISVEVERGGKKRIRVLDNGCGMTAEQAELALQRHATSKISAFDDLLSLGTFGFRGEALPSIAAVSRMTLTTRPALEETVAARRLVIEGGLIVSRGEAGAPVGTCIEICDLLYNVPARQKFLKGDATETSHISDVMSKLALANPSVHFRLKNNARTTLNAPLHGQHKDRVRAVMGERLGRDVQDATAEYGGVRVRAFVGAPDAAQSTTRGLQLFVGRRAIRDRGLLHAVIQGYGELLPRGRYPVAVILITVPNADVDVNVHPQKLEVRFSDAQLVYAAVRQTVRSAVGQGQWSSAASLNPELSARPASKLAADYAAHERSRRMLPWAGSRKTQERPMPAREIRVPAQEPLPKTASTPAARPIPEMSAAPPRPTQATDFFASLRYMGQLDCTYLLCESAGELVLLDQHAALEQIQYARLMREFGEGNVPIQRLLFPEQLELDEADAVVAERCKDVLATAGFDFDVQGLKTVPAGLRSEAAVVLKEILSRLAKGSDQQSQDIVIAAIACHSAIAGGEKLGQQQVSALLSGLDEVTNLRGPIHTAIVVRVSMDEIARRFRN